MKPAINSFLPLAPATLHILLSMAGEKMYGYAIMQEVARQSDGRYKLGPGTLYDNLQRLMKQGLVEEVAGKPQIVDVIVAGTSLRITTRNDYASVITSNGGQVSSLLTVMQNKINQIKADQ